MKNFFLIGAILCAFSTTAQKGIAPTIAYRYLHLPADSANNLLFADDDAKAQNFLLDVQQAVARNLVNVYDDKSDIGFVFPLAMDPVEYVIDPLTGQALREIPRVSYFEMNTDQKKPEPNNQDIYEFITRPILASEMAEIRVLETGTWDKKASEFIFSPTFIGFERKEVNELGKKLVWLNLQELSDVQGLSAKKWMKFFLSQQYKGFQYKQYLYEPVFRKEDCIQAKWTVIDRTEVNKVLFADENPSYSMLGQLAIYIDQGEIEMETKNPYRYSQGKTDEVIMNRRSKEPIKDENGEPYAFINDAGETVFAYPYDAELALSTGKLKHIKVYEVDNIAESLHFIFDENGKDVEYFSMQVKSLVDMGPRISSEPWFEIIRLHKYQARTMRQANCLDKIMRD